MRPFSQIHKIERPSASYGSVMYGCAQKAVHRRGRVLLTDHTEWAIPCACTPRVLPGWGFEIRERISERTWDRYPRKVIVPRYATLVN